MVGLAADQRRAGGISLGASGVLFFIATYALTNLGAFIVVIAISDRTRQRRNQLTTRASASVALAGRGLALALISLTGIPPTAGFIAKLYIFNAAIQSDLDLARRDRRAQQRHLAPSTTCKHRRHHVPRRAASSSESLTTSPSLRAGVGRCRRGHPRRRHRAVAAAARRARRCCRLRRAVTDAMPPTACPFRSCRAAAAAYPSPSCAAWPATCSTPKTWRPPSKSRSCSPTTRPCSELNRLYRGKDEPTDVLSFATQRGRSVPRLTGRSAVAGRGNRLPAGRRRRRPPRGRPHRRRRSSASHSSTACCTSSATTTRTPQTLPRMQASEDELLGAAGLRGAVRARRALAGRFRSYRPGFGLTFGSYGSVQQ